MAEINVFDTYTARGRRLKVVGSVCIQDRWLNSCKDLETGEYINVPNFELKPEKEPARPKGSPAKSSQPKPAQVALNI